MKLYGYWRSSSAFRVRIVLGLKGIQVEHVPVHLVLDGGQQFRAEFRDRNPLAEVPVLELDSGEVLAQSVAIVEYLEETQPAPPLLPADALGRARVRALVQVVNSGIQPLQNRQVLLELQRLGVDSDAWTRHYIERGLTALERHAERRSGTFSHGDTPTLADAYLIPQLYNARRWSMPLEAYPNLLGIESRCLALEAFDRARPERQPDAEPTPGG
jgi:maleylacetoacetate isomerase